MTKIPKKLPTNSQNYGSEVKLELVRLKVDEIISYLQAKEEEMSSMLDIAEERGYWQGRKEAKKDKSYKAASSVCCDSSFRLEGDTKEGTMYHVCNNCNKACDIKLTEKKVEASKGECKKVCGDIHYHSFSRYSDKCLGCDKTLEEVVRKPSNPPEHEETIGEWVYDFEKKFGALYENNEVYANVKVKDYIRDNFVSKEKIKKWSDRLRLECDVVVCDCGEKVVDWDISDLVNDMIKDLGLGD